MSEIELQDAILRHALELQRLSAHEEAQALAILQQLEDELRALLASRTLSDATRRELAALIDQADTAIQARYAGVAASVDTHSLVLIVAENTVKALDAAIPAAIASPSATTLSSLAKEVLIDGAPSAAWWEKQGEDTAFKFAAAVRQGVVNNETQGQIVQRIVGKRGEPGILDLARRNARTLVHSSVMSAANHARLATFNKNGQHLRGVRWLSTLDSHTCVRCAVLDGAVWDLDGAPLDGTKMQFQSPPLHFSCRCVLSPVAKTFADIGLDIPEPEPGQRASSMGPVHGATTFNDFLARQSPAFVEEMLGKRRAELYLAGKLTLSDLVSGTGRELTLDELKARA